MMAWPLLKRLPSLLASLGGMIPKPSPVKPAYHSVIDDVVCLRKHLLSDPAALKAIDEIILPSAIKMASEETDDVRYV